MNLKNILSSGFKTIKAHDSNLRSIMKAFTWRITATLTTFFIALFVTEQAEIALVIGVSEFFLKMGIYYVHERLWLRVG